MNKLKPCPFCGGAARIDSHPAPFSEGDVYRVFCTEQPCKAQPSTLHQDTEAEAVAAWNTRPDIRNKTIEECALLLENEYAHKRWLAPSEIRALKE